MISPNTVLARDSYRDLRLSCLTTDLLSLIAERALAAQQRGEIIDHEWSWADKLNFFPGWRDIAALHDIMADCRIPCRVGVQLLAPKVLMPVHIDASHAGWRSCSIATILWPQQAIPSTYWYNSLESPVDEPAVTATWRPHQSKLLNVMTPHGGIRVGDQWRITLQISFGTSFAETVALIEQKQLWKTIDCSLDDDRD